MKTWIQKNDQKRNRKILGTRSKCWLNFLKIGDFKE